MMASRSFLRWRGLLMPSFFSKSPSENTIMASPEVTFSFTAPTYWLMPEWWTGRGRGRGGEWRITMYTEFL